MTRPVFSRAFSPAFMAAADTALQEQKLKRNCTHTMKHLRTAMQGRSSAASDFAWKATCTSDRIHLLTRAASSAIVCSEICHSTHVCEPGHLYYEFTESLSPVWTIQRSNCRHRVCSAHASKWLSAPPANDAGLSLHRFLTASRYSRRQALSRSLSGTPPERRTSRHCLHEFDHSSVMQGEKGSLHSPG